MTICKPYDESTADDFKRLFTERFPNGDATLLETFLANPARKNHPSTGAIAYDETGAVMSILGTIPRAVYWGQTPLRALNGVAIARRRDANRDSFSDFIRDSIQSDGADLYFVNTAIPPSRKRTALAIGSVDGPESCAEIRERRLRSNGAFSRVLRKVCTWGRGGAPRPGAVVVLSVRRGEPPRPRDLVVSRESAIADTDFNAFWQSYLKTNVGLVSSRTAEELRWVFGKGLSSGEIVMITAREDGALCGYVFCNRTDESGTCWRVVDLIALGNDEKVLEALIEGASRFLRKRTPALCLQITGYPTWVQPLLKRLFPKSSPFGFNRCIWSPLSEKVKALCGDWVNASNGWYGSPYDGDMCLM